MTGGAPGGDPFCNAPTVPGSAYCPAHRALCEIAPGTARGRAALAELKREAERAPPPPPELGFADLAPPPEREPEEEGALEALLPLPAREGEGKEGAP